MEREDLARARLGIAAISEPGDNARALINKGQRFLVIHPFELGGGIATGLLLDGGDLLSPVFGFGFDNADGFLIDEKGIISRPNIGLVFLDGYAATGAEIDLLVALNDPACLLK